MPTPTRRYVLMVAVLVLLGVGFALVPARGESIYRFQFGGKNVAFVRGDANMKVEEKEHDISDRFFKSQPTSEHVKVTADAATGDAAFLHYHYDTPPALITPALSAGVWVRCTRPGVQLRARVVFPKEPDPARPESPLTALIVGDTHNGENWQKLTLTDVPALLGKRLPILQTQIGRAVNADGAYIDRIVLNLYTGPGTADVWIDDLDIGPVKGAEGAGGAPGEVVKRPKPGTEKKGARGRLSRQEGGQLFVDNKPFFFRAVRHTGAPLHVLRQAGFDSLWVPADVPADVLEEANREGWLVVPSVPTALPAAPTANSTAEAAALDAYYRKFADSDVLFYDLGSGRQQEQTGAVERTRDYLRLRDPKRPFSAGVWDGFKGYSAFLDAVGTYRWPLFTSLEMEGYRGWLAQRMSLSSKRAVFWTWIQNHAPDWYVESVASVSPGGGFAEPIGPHPDQVRLLAYLSVACGCRGLGFWSDQYLADSHHGRGRLQGMAILNSELEMLAPVLLAGDQQPQWLDTSHEYVKAALIKGNLSGNFGAVLLPIWLGPGSQYVPGQGALNDLTVTVPLVADGADPWRISPAGVTCLRNDAQKVPGGTRLTIREFDLVTPIVFTNDVSQNGLVVQWQDYNRKYGRLAARWAMDLAAEEYDKTLATHRKLAEMGVQIRGADSLFQLAAQRHTAAQRHAAAGLHAQAFADAQGALRPLRVVMWDHWKKATETLDVPSASPFAVSYHSLPKHWELFREIQSCQVGVSALPGGAFEPVGGGPLPKDGAPVSELPGWSARFGTLDRVKVAAGLVPADQTTDKPDVKTPEYLGLKMWRPSREITRPGDGYEPPAPQLGRGVLKLEVRRRGDVAPDGKPVEQSTMPLERTFLAVESPPVNLPPGSLVRVSGWVKIPGEISLTSDGAMLYDSAGGEPLAVRVTKTKGKWKQFHLYRRVPASGQISLTLALTGVGVAYFDDVRIEPLHPTAQGAQYGARPGPRGAAPVVPAGAVRPTAPVVPAGGVRPR
ncbi:hypothetical protein R5W24_003445 [Gemmata sp. JC717]|uniref:hypothetical protein n=1 Tax=Gemmata algarum TaxID=2975278 RepID=UPI0021BB74B1|nr:hypothetical protein [Gemmata algarum]MDY3554325.1 hypothetical protein [Gemmata algarum]